MAKSIKADLPQVSVRLPDSTDVLPKESKVTVFAIHKAADGGGYASAYGVTEYEIDHATLIKNAKVISKTEPDLLAIALASLERKVKTLLGI